MDLWEVRTCRVVNTGVSNVGSAFVFGVNQTNEWQLNPH